MDLEAYIEKKFISFKFPLIDKTEEEVKKIKSDLNKRGLLHSGRFISLPYKIRQNAIEIFTKEFLKLEIEVREKNNIEFNEDMFKKIEDKLIKFVDHEFENLIFETKRDANLINFGDENFEKGFLPNILSDKNKIIDSMKNELEIKKYELLLISTAKLEIKKEEQKEYDAFLSHADEDKESIADELFGRLKNDEFKIWYDKNIKAGQSIPEKINEGIKQSKNGIVIFSKYYEKSQWCKEEFAALTYKSKSCQNFEIIIILHNFDLDTFTKEYPIHAHRLILLSNIGIDKIIGEIEPQLKLNNNLNKKNLGEVIIPTEMNVREKIEKGASDIVGLSSDRQSLRKVINWLPEDWQVGILVVRDDNPIRWGKNSQMYYYLEVKSQGGILNATWGAQNFYYYKSFTEIKEAIIKNYPTNITNWADGSFSAGTVLRDDPIWQKNELWKDDTFWKNNF